MSETRAKNISASYGGGLLLAVGAVAAAGAAYGGAEGAWGATVGGTAVAVDFYLLYVFAGTWLEGARRRRGRPLARGLVVLALKTLLPPAALGAIAATGLASVIAVAGGALVVATAAPAALAIGFSWKMRDFKPAAGVWRN